MFNDYDNFKKEFKRYEDHDWETTYNEPTESELKLKDGHHWLKIAEGYNKPDTISFSSSTDQIFHPFGQKDMVNSPAHYTRGTQEVIDIIEESIQDAPDVKSGMLQAQALKYMLRLWLKVMHLKMLRKHDGISIV